MLSVQCFSTGKTKMCIFLVFLVTLLGLTTIIHTVTNMSSRYTMTDTMLRDNLDRRPPRDKDVKIILLWNKKYGISYEGIPERAFRSVCADPPPCLATHDQRLLTKADAVVFFVWNRFVKMKSTQLPKWRSSTQQYVFYGHESPSSIDYHLDRYDHYFNLTMTYRYESDLPMTYGRVLPRNNPTANSTSHKPEVNTKSKLAVWVVSHCQTQSQREVYVEELKNHMPLDVIGKCGVGDCGGKTYRNIFKCHETISKTYKFYLAFENSICKDYVTEKFLNILQLDVVPVVMNGADMKKLFPQRSYIDVDDFESPKELAEYLMYLDDNDKEYWSYFQWRAWYYVQGQEMAMRVTYCYLCRFLHRPIERRKSYSSRELREHWGPQTCNDSYMEKMKARWMENSGSSSVL